MSTASSLLSSPSAKGFSSFADQVQQTVDMKDEIQRNLMITLGYHDIAEALRHMTGGVDVNWCTFGSWASKTAGTFIRKEEFNGIISSEFLQSETLKTQFDKFIKNLQNSLKNGEYSSLANFDLAWDAQAFEAFFEHIVNDVSLYIMQGNLVVFQELAGAFATMIDHFKDAESFDNDEVMNFLKRWPSGDPRPDLVSLNSDHSDISSQAQGGQGMLTEAMLHYLQAKFETNVKRRAELVLLANAYGGLHEQMRLQSYITGSMNIPVQDFFYRFIDELIQKHIQSHKSLLKKGSEEAAYLAFKSVAGKYLPALLDKINDVFRSISTRFMMVLELPDGNVKLGQDIPAPKGSPLFPPSLQEVENEELRQTLDQYDALDVNFESLNLIEKVEYAIENVLSTIGVPPKKILGTHATDWGSYSQRMKFIMDLFRSRQQDPNLNAIPFSPEQVEQLRGGQMPEGQL